MDHHQVVKSLKRAYLDSYNSPAIYAILFLWLAFTGGFEGWAGETLVYNAWLSLGVVIAWLWLRPGLKRLSWPLMAFMGVGLVSLYVKQTANVSFLYLLLVGIAVYHLKGSDLKRVRAGAYWAALVYLPLSPLLAENSNVIAFNIWALFFLTGRFSWLFSGLAVVTMAYTGSDGGLLALIGGLAFYKWQWGGLGAVVLGGAVMLGLKWGDVASVTNRLDLLAYAWNGFLQSPIVGNGPGSFHAVAGSGWGAWHSHNLIADIAYGFGLTGLICFGWLVSRSPATPFTIAFLIHSMVDGPVYIFLPLVGLFILLGGLHGNVLDSSFAKYSNINPGLDYRPDVP